MRMKKASVCFWDFNSDIKILLKAVLNDERFGIVNFHSRKTAFGDDLIASDRVGMVFEIFSENEIATEDAQDVFTKVQLVIKLEEANKKLSKCLMVLRGSVNIVIEVKVPFECRVQN